MNNTFDCFDNGEYGTETTSDAKAVQSGIYTAIATPVAYCSSSCQPVVPTPDPTDENPYQPEVPDPKPGGSSGSTIDKTTDGTYPNVPNPKPGGSSSNSTSGGTYPSVSDPNPTGGSTSSTTSGGTHPGVSDPNPTGGSTTNTTTAKPTVKVNSIVLSETNLTLEMYKNTILHADVYPANVTDSSLNWSSSNPNVVSTLCGLVFTKGIGTATITATANDGSGINVSCDVTVIPGIPITSIKIEPTSKK